MYLIFEETGKLLAARLLGESDTAAQLELDSGKRVKVKTANILLRFEKPEPAALLAAAQAQATGIELDLAWEFAPDEEFSFAELARDYFSLQASLTEQLGMLLALFGAPHYFRRAGKGRFRKASAEVLAQALAAIEKKKLAAQQVAAWAKELSEGLCPQSIRAQLYKILFKPDKNAAEYKAVVEASHATHMGPLALLVKAGAISSPYQFHWKRFLLENFPAGTAFPKLAAACVTEALPLSSAQAFSIDDSATTEIDDAISVQGLGSASVLLGIHIAAPGLAIAPGSALDKVARARLSTVYMPGYKLTMLPDEVVQNYTLQQGCACPALSLYLTLDATTLALSASETKIERVFIQANLRYDQLDQVVTTEWLEDASFEHANAAPCLAEQRAALAFLYRLAQQLKAQRERLRGKPENFSRPDYNYRLIRATPLAAMAPTPEGRPNELTSLQGTKSDHPSVEPDGTEQVQITRRQRGAPLDLIVAETMILANSSWGGWLAELGVPAIYRSQASLAPGVKVRMGTKAQPHAGIGVKSYAWSSSPLRRYVDLVNQWQIIACVRHGKTAALAAPFKPKDAELFAIISNFDASYAAYHDFQNAMERFWVLKYLKQQGIREIDATLFKDNLVRADDLPLVLPVTGSQGLARWARVRVRLGDIDELALDVQASVSARLDSPGSAPSGDESEDDDSAVGPLSIAVDLDDSASTTSPSAAPVPDEP